MGLAAALLLPSLRLRASAIAAVAALFVFSGFTVADTTLADGDDIDLDTEYSRVRVFHDIDWYTGRPVLRMNVNDGYSSAMFTDTDDDTDLVYPYTRFYRLAEHFVPEIKRGLMIGGAAYSFPKSFLMRHPDAVLDVVEIDAELTHLARTYFDLPLDHPRLSVVHEDARTFLNRSNETYDAIYMDAFHSNAVPYQLASREATVQMHDLLNENGVLITNTISPINGEDGRFFRALYWTYREVFPRVEIFPVRDTYNPERTGNVMVVAFKNGAPAGGEPSFSSDDAELASYVDNLYRRGVAHDVPVLTDEKNAADYYSAAYIGRLRR